MPKTILHISTRLILGGSQENTVLSCEGQANLGHNVHLAFGPIYGPEGSLLERVANFRTNDNRTITTHTIPSLIRSIHPIADARALAQLKALIRHLQPDIVHTHSSKAGILGRLAASASNHPHRPAIVHTIHGPPFHPSAPPFANTLYTIAERIAARRSHLIVSVADAMTEQFLARRIGTPDLYRTVRSGMEIEPFLNAADDAQLRNITRSALNIPPTATVLATIARLADQKGHDDLLDALPPVLADHPEAILLWIGDGWRRDKLQQRIAELKLTTRVILTGLIPPEHIPAHLAASDILIHPSYREGLPRTVVQAALARRPIIATDADGTREVITDAVTGRLIPIADQAALAEATRWMLADPQRRAACAERARARCIHDFDARAMVAELETIYDEAIHRSRATPPRRGANNPQ